MGFWRFPLVACISSGMLKSASKHSWPLTCLTSEARKPASSHENQHAVFIKHVGCIWPIDICKQYSLCPNYNTNMTIRWTALESRSAQATSSLPAVAGLELPCSLPSMRSSANGGKEGTVVRCVEVVDVLPDCCLYAKTLPEPHSAVGSLHEHHIP